MTDKAEIEATVKAVIETFNKKGVAVTDETRFAQDLEWDSLTVLDFVATIEDEFDVLISGKEAQGQFGGALAVADEAPDIARKVIEAARSSIGL